MPVSVAADFMPAAGDVAHEFREAIGHPAEYEKRALSLMPVEQSQYTMRVGDDAAHIGVPAGRRNAIGKCSDVVVILHVDGERVS